MNTKDQANKSLTSTNKWTYVPGKVFTLPPLNIKDIKKQLLERAKAEIEYVSENAQVLEEQESKHLNNDSLKETQMEIKIGNMNAISEIIKNTSNEVSKSNQPDKHSSISSLFEPLVEDLEPQNFSEHVTAIIGDNKENIPCNMEPLNLSRNKKKNDSFDLDFSALSLHTPVKHTEAHFNYATPKINIIPPSNSKSTKQIGSIFVTPKVNISKNHLFKTPVNKPLKIVQRSASRPSATPQGMLYNSLKKSCPPQCHVIPEIIKEDEFNKLTVKNVNYIVMNFLGKGGSSEVFHCFNVEERLHVAIKLVPLSDPATAEGYINEVKLLESLQKCDRIIKMYDFEINREQEKLIVILEKGCEDLSAILKQLAVKQSHIPTYMLLFYWLEMLYAVQQIHSNGVIHSDLKPGNFLRAGDGLKLIDFGIANRVQEDMTCVYKSNQEGSCNYISPEALKTQTNENVNSPNYGKPKYKVHFKSDVWSLGCILYQLVYRITPFHHLNPIWAKLGAIMDPNHKIQYPPADWVSPRFVNTIKMCLQHDVKSRPSVHELIEEYEEILKNL